MTSQRSSYPYWLMCENSGPSSDGVRGPALTEVQQQPPTRRNYV